MVERYAWLVTSGGTIRRYVLVRHTEAHVFVRDHGRTIRKRFREAGIWFWFLCEMDALTFRERKLLQLRAETETELARINGEAAKPNPVMVVPHEFPFPPNAKIKLD